MLRILLFIFLIPLPLCTSMAWAETSENNWQPVYKFGKDKQHNLRGTTSAQFWLRYTDLNPGTLVDDKPTDSSWDLSIRRFRLGASLELGKRIFFRLNTGINNLNSRAPSTPQYKMLDLYGEYRQWQAFEFGLGLSAWRGLSRNTVPHTSAQLTGDIPLITTPTLNVKDDTLRTLNLYAKGQIGKIDYRVVFFEPNKVGQSPGIGTEPPQGIASFVDDPADEGNGFSTYVKWQFFEHEPNRTPFSVGSYLGQRKVWNIGIGYEFQQDGASYFDQGEEQFVNLEQWAVDTFAELPLSSGNGRAVTLYAAYYDYDFGPNLIRNIAVNNIASGVDQEAVSFNGAGNGYPVVGTGRAGYLQGGYLTKTFRWGQLQPFFDIQYADWQRLDDRMLAWNLGLNWLLKGQKSKLSINLQNRPIFVEESNRISQEEYKKLIYLQYQWIL